MSNKLIIADSGPLIAFGRIDNLGLLSKLFNPIIIPQAVADECLAKALPGAAAINQAIKKGIIQIHSNPSLSNFDNVLDLLDEGEATAIKLSYSLKLPLLIDEKLGRGVAKKLEIKIIGTAGILVLAKEEKVIESVKPMIDELKNVGYYLSDSLIKEVLKRANEN